MQFNSLGESDKMLARLKLACLKAWMKSVARHTRPQPGEPGPFRRIAIWQFGGVGDMLLATPAIDALQKAYPGAEIQVWCSYPSFAEFMHGFEQVKAVCLFRVYDFDSRTLLRSQTRRELHDVLARMQAFSPDLLVNLHTPMLLDWWAVEWWLVRKLAPRLSLGFDPAFTGGRSVFDVSMDEEARFGLHYTRFYRLLVEKAGIACGERTIFPVMDAEKRTAMALLAESVPQAKRKVCVHIGARRQKIDGKMWPLERFAALAGRLLEAGLQPVLIGVASEQEMAASLCAKVPACVSLVGRTSLGEMAALIGLCDGLIGHDSGPFHVAVAVGTPCVVICGRRDADPGYQCYERDDVVVMLGDSPEQITVDAVLACAMDLFKHG